MRTITALNAAAPNALCGCTNSRQPKQLTRNAACAVWRVTRGFTWYYHRNNSVRILRLTHTSRAHTRPSATRTAYSMCSNTLWCVLSGTALAWQPHRRRASRCRTRCTFGTCGQYSTVLYGTLRYSPHSMHVWNLRTVRSAAAVWLWPNKHRWTDRKQT